MSTRAVIFDLDGVLTDTAELHYLSWQAVADALRLPFDRAANEHLRGLSREESLARVLGSHADTFSDTRKADLTRKKNELYLTLVARMSRADLFAGAAELLGELRSAGAKLAIASSSRNAQIVVQRLGIADRFDAIVDGNDAPRSKPDPQVFLLAAERLGASPAECVVIEDAASGVAAARAANMRVIGIGPAERVGGADLIVPTIAELRAAAVLSSAG